MKLVTNIYDLCDNKTVKVVLNNKLRNLILNKIDNKKLNQIAKELNITYSTLWKYINKRYSVPLELFKILNINLPKSIILESGSKRNKVKLPPLLTEDLAKIIGAYVADGHLRRRITVWNENKNATHYEFVLREEYKTNVDSFCRWFNNSFGTKIVPIKRKNHYEVYVSNKIIFLYLTRILRLLTGKKVNIIDIPEYIKDSSKNIQISFLKGLFMFDGGVDYRNGYVTLISKSERLINSVHQILNNLGMSSHYCSRKQDKFGRYRILIRDRESLKKSLILFEKNTEKWHRLHENLYGFKYNKIQKLDTFLYKLNKYYPKKRKSSINFNDVILVVNGLDEANFKDISLKLSRKKTVVYEFLNKLKRWKILKNKQKGLNKVWMIQNNLPIIRR